MMDTRGWELEHDLPEGLEEVCGRVQDAISELEGNWPLAAIAIVMCAGAIASGRSSEELVAAFSKLIRLNYPNVKEALAAAKKTQAERRRAEGDRG